MILQSHYWTFIQRKLEKMHEPQCLPQHCLQWPRHGDSLHVQIDVLMKKMWYIYTMEYYSASKKNGIMPSEASRTSLLYHIKWSQFSSFHSLSCVWLFATPWIAARQASLSVTKSRNLLKLTSIVSVMPSSDLILCRPLFLLPPIPPSIRVFSNESALRMRWPKYWSFSFSIISSKGHPGLISFRMD